MTKLDTIKKRRRTLISVQTLFVTPKNKYSLLDIYQETKYFLAQLSVQQLATSRFVAHHLQSKQGKHW